MKQKPAPELQDLSSKSIKRVVRNESLFHPLTLYPTALGILSGLAAVMYDLPLFFLTMGGLLGIGAATSIINFFFRDQAISMKHIEKVTRALKQKQQKVLATLEKDLRESTKIPGLEKYARQGLEQFSRVEKKYNRLTGLLGKKFSTTELTYGAYVGAAEQLHLSLLDNLMKVVSLLQGAESIDPGYIEQRKRELHGLSQVTQADEREFEALEKRLELRKSGLEQVNSLLTENEESMTIMDSTIAAIADLDIGVKFAENDLKSAMVYLQEIADRTEQYDRD